MDLSRNPVTDQLGQDVYIFGAGKFAHDVTLALEARNYNVLGHIVSHLPDGASKAWEGRRLLSLEMAEADGVLCEHQILLAVFNRDNCLYEITKSLRSNRSREPSRIVPPWCYYPLIKEAMGWRYWLGDISYSRDDFIQLSHHLDDTESLNTLLAVESFRAGSQLVMACPCSRDQQYFNSITLPRLKNASRGVSYLDVGAYIGDSWLELRKLVEIGKAFLFEPEPGNYLRLTTNLSAAINTGEVAAFMIALSDMEGECKLFGVGESASLLDQPTEDNNPSFSLIPTARADILLADEKVDLIKIDAEGCDCAALDGAEALIKNNRPVLAISVYHRPDDLVLLPLRVISMTSEMGYKYYLRCHKHNTFDVVFYAVPPCPSA